MKSFHTIIDPQTSSPSPRSSLIQVGGRHSRSPSREITPPSSLSTADSSGTSYFTPAPRPSALLAFRCRMLIKSSLSPFPACQCPMLFSVIIGATTVHVATGVVHVATGVVHVHVHPVSTYT